jgi:replicative DNA helicase
LSVNYDIINFEENFIFSFIVSEKEIQDIVLENVNKEDFIGPFNKEWFDLILYIKEKKGKEEKVQVSDIIANSERIESLWINLFGENNVYQEYVKQKIIDIKENGALFSSKESLDHYIELLRTNKNISIFKSKLQQVIDTSDSLLRDPSVFSVDQIENTYGEILGILEKKDDSKKETRHIGSFIPCLDSGIRRYWETGEKESGVLSGFNKIDRMNDGFWPQDFIVLAARPGMGKTSFMLKTAYNIAKRNKGVYVFSLEMSGMQLFVKLVSILSGVEIKKIRTKTVMEYEYPKIEKAYNKIYDIPLYIDDSSGITPSYIRNSIKKRMKKEEISIVFIDYLQLMNTEKRFIGHTEKVTEISKEIKEIAKDLNIPIIALCQLSRKNEDRIDKRPVLSDLRNSGAIEQDADSVMFIYRENYYNSQGRDADLDFEDYDVNRINEPHKAEIIIAKQRNGEVGTVEIMFSPVKTDFYE